MPFCAMTRMTATARAAPLTAPASVITKALISRLPPSLLGGQWPRRTDDVIGVLPVGRALRQLAPRAGGKDHRPAHVAHNIPLLSGGEVGHRFVLEHAVGRRRLKPD